MCTSLFCIGTSQSEYNSINYPTFVAEELAEIKAKHDEMVSWVALRESPRVTLGFLPALLVQ